MRVIVAAGGSGGHIFPAIAVSREIAATGKAEVIFAASKRRLDAELLGKEGFKKIFFLRNPMPHRFGPGIFLFAGKLLIDVIKSLYVLARFRPQAIAAFGGDTGACLVFLGSRLKIPTLIHEQNAVPGRATKMLDRFVDEVCVSFDKTKEFFKNKNITLTGNPIRSRFLNGAGKNRQNALDLGKGKFTILVMGGSQGARNLNKLTIDAISSLSDKSKENIQIIHLAGPHDYALVKAAYERLGVENRTFTFIENIEDAYSRCDLAITRAGAASCFELAYYKKPMILIPYPGKLNNQRYNAAYLEEQGACVYREEKDLSGPDLARVVEDLIGNHKKRLDMSVRASFLSRPDAAGLVAGEIINLAASGARSTV